VETHVYSRYGLDKDVIVRGDYAYVKENIKFKIIDISDMQNPFETGYYEFGWGYNDIHLVGDVAFLSNGGYNCLYALDISDPYSPEVIDIYRDEGNDVHYRMKLHGRYAYIVENYGLEIVDISNPEEMVHAGNYSEYIGNAKIEIADRYLFLRSSSYDDPLEVFDISDPLSPVFVTGYQIGSGLRKMKAADGYLYLITTQHLLIFRATDFRQWQPIANFQVFTDDRRLSDLEIEGNYVYLTCADNGLYMYDISDREDPTYVTNNTTPGSASGVFVTDGIAYVADGSNLGFYDCTGVTGVKDKYQTLPSSFALISSYPNPFNASTRIQFEMSGAGHVTLTVFDVLGQNVSTLANREFEAGTHSLIWNGTGRDGRTVASGRYYIKARTGDSMEKMPITLLK
ncbi:MAG: T9SS type A sorting domain-containing protein, partial [candidate division Zixibacteria bacterium]|nr:T9SS type A sorting domain-containing protein [candidate division Zixibacteria bacterium]